MKDLSKIDQLPILYLDDKQYFIFEHKTSRITENKYVDYVDLSPNNKTDIGEVDIWFFRRYGDNILFDYDIIGRSDHMFGVVIQIKKNSFKKYKIYFISFMKSIERKILLTLRIWEFLDCDVAMMPSWKDLKIFKRFRNVK